MPNYDERADATMVDIHSATRRECMNTPVNHTPESIPLPPELSEDDLGIQYVDRYGGMYRWTAGKDWMVFTGKVWEQDRRNTRYTNARNICRSAAAVAPDKDQKRLCSAASVNSTVALAKYDPRIIVPVEAWDHDRMALNTPKGIVDLKTGSTRQRLNTDYITQITTVSPDKDCDTSRFRQFLAEVFQEDAEVISFMQRLLGYTLTGDISEQILAFCYGVGSNGKNTLLDLAMEIMGTYSLKLGADVLMHQRHSGHPTELAQLHGKRLAFSNEIESGHYWAESRIKELTGDAQLSARYMRQDFFTFDQTQKHIVAGNYRPRLKGGDAGIARRMVLVPFNACFRGKNKDKGLPEKLAKESPGILQWMIEGAVIWSQAGLHVPEKIRAASEEYMSDMDDFAMWVEDCCTLDPYGNGFTRSALLFECYHYWKKARNEAPLNSKGFADELQRRFPTVTHKRQKDGRGFCGISLVAGEESAARSRLAEKC